jgi:hypothetical protein
MARRALVSLIAASALSACGGGSGSGSALPGGGSALPGAANVPPVTLATTPPPLAGTPSSTVTPTSTTPTVAQAATAGTAGNAKSLTASLASAPAAGSLIVAFIGTGDAATVTTPPSGWSAAVDAAGHACQAMTGGADTQGEQVYVHTAAAGEGAAKYTFTFASAGGSPYAIALLEVRNAQNTKPIAACAAANPAKSTATAKLASATLTATAANQLPLVGYAPSTSGLTVTRSSGWTGTLYNAPQTPWLTLDVEYGPLSTAAGGTVAPTTTVSAPTIVYAPSVDLLIAAGTGATPASPGAPSAGPSAIPAPTSTPAPQVGTLQNGVAWAASFRAYGPTSYWNRPMSNLTNPILYANSDTIVNNVETNDPGPDVHTSEYGAGYSDAHPVVFASSSDPVVNVKCTQYCSNPNIPATIHIPARARPATAGDGHLGVVQPDGTEVDFWAVNPNQPQHVSDWTSGATLTAQSAAGCGNFYTGPGSTTAATTVGGACLAAGVIRYNEIVSGSINHALFMTTACFAPNTYVYPATQNGDVGCTGSPNAPLGSHIWLDLSDAQVNALPIAAWEKTLLRAMHNYGGYLMDSGGSPQTYTDTLARFASFEDDGQYSAFGVTSPWQTWAAAQGWNAASISPASAGYIQATRYISPNSPWNPLSSVGGWKQHLHIVDPCYAHGSC